MVNYTHTLKREFLFNYSLFETLKKKDYYLNFHDLLSKILMPNPKFFHYKGSLTTPPCTETVNWFVHHQAVHVLYEDLEPFFARWINDESFSNGKGNCRHCFHSKGREICIVKAHH